MKTDATLTRLLQEMPALTADLEGRLHGGFCAFCDTDSCEEITKDNADCNCCLLYTSHKADMTRCAERWCELLVEAGADHARLMPSAGNPLVYAERHVSDDARTVLIYAHYDVMPAEPLELWKSNPFEPEVRDGHIFARGADDDKMCIRDRF